MGLWMLNLNETNHKKLFSTLVFDFVYLNRLKCSIEGRTKV